MRIELGMLVDGPSDAVLATITEWLLLDRFPEAVLAEIRVMPRRHRALPQAVEDAWRESGATLLVVHRDAEAASPPSREDEIPGGEGLVRCVPVRMTEAWLLGDASAIRRAAGNPSGQEELRLPRMRRVEALPDPKATLRDALLRAAGEPTGRRRKRLLRELPRRARLVADYTADFSGLRAVPAFDRYESSLVEAIAEGFGVSGR